MKKIYCISGLGADEKAFARIKVPGYELVHIRWLEPKKNEPLEAYAKRLGKTIEEDNPILMGLSFGGMMCIEIAKLRPVEKVILISSVSSFKQLPLWMRTAGRLTLNKVVPLHPSSVLLRPVQDFYLGVSAKQEKEIVQRYRENVSPQYLQWAINAILNWKNDKQPCRVFHIHGDADRIFPARNVKPDRIIKGGTHFMIFTKAREINQWLASVLKL